MIRIILSGCCGKMGRVIAACVKEREDCAITAGIDLAENNGGDFPVVSDFPRLNAEADVIIDFSNPALLSSLLDYAVSHKNPAVICTTGFSKEQVAAIKEASKEIPVFYSGNMSLGVNLLIELSKKAASVLGQDFDIEIIEKHHHHKVDAPSGTALMIADQISSVLEEEPRYVYDRHSYRKARSKSEIGIHSVRGGTIVGEHDVIFAGRDEVLTISHSAQSKEIFAVGSVNAAVFLAGQEPGLYNMADLLRNA